MSDKPSAKKSGLYVHMPRPVLRHLQKRLRAALDGDYVLPGDKVVRAGALQSAVLLHFAALDLEAQRPIVESGLAIYAELTAEVAVEPARTTPAPKAPVKPGPPAMHEEGVPAEESGRAPRKRRGAR